MFEDSLGRGERQARAVVLLVLAIEAVWIFLHKYLPADAALWTLQSDLVGLHLNGTSHDALSLVPFPAANVLGGYIGWLFSLPFGSEVGIRFAFAFIGLFLRGYAMLRLLGALRVRDPAVYYLIPVFAWSGIYWSGAFHYIIAETAALFLITYLLKQDHPRSFQYGVLAIGIAFVALLHSLAFIACLFFCIAVANEQRRSVHLSQGWLSNINSVVGLAVPGLVILLLRLLSPAPIFQVSMSGFLPTDGSQLLLAMATVSPYVPEAAFPTANIIAPLVSLFVVLLVVSSLVRAFLLPMEEVSWQSRSTKGAGALLIVISFTGLFLPFAHTQALFWFASFMVLAGSYSRGPAVRRSSIDRLLTALGFIAMLAAGGLNALSINRGSDAAVDVRQSAVDMILEAKHTGASDIHYVIDSVLHRSLSESYIGTISFAQSAPLYLYQRETILNDPQQYQTAAGTFRGEDSAYHRPFDPPRLLQKDGTFADGVRILAIVPSGATRSDQFGAGVGSLENELRLPIAKGSAKFDLLLGKPSQNVVKGLASR
jgi:hypothetical protein